MQPVESSLPFVLQLLAQLLEVQAVAVNLRMGQAGAGRDGSREITTPSPEVVVIGRAAKRVAEIPVRAQVGGQPGVRLSLSGLSPVPVLRSQTVAQPGTALCQTVPAAACIRGSRERGGQAGRWARSMRP